ncbi:MAG: AMP-binding protein [Proteobacteria bacterium]|nr:AMP-binding protein [Pseudomonadota bacterium]
MNLYAHLQPHFQKDGIAIETATGLAYSWADVDRASARMANLLHSLALPPASRVAAQVDKSVEALLLYLAVLRAGHVFLPLNTAYTADELAYFIADAEPAVVVCTGAAFPWLSKLAFKQGVGHVYTLESDRTGTLLDRAAFHADAQQPVPRSPDDLAAILYTSGTTGRSKGALLTHGNLASNADVLHAYWDWRADDVLLHALPIFHVHGLFVACHGALRAGARMLWFDRFEPRAVLARLPEATVIMGVPTMYTRLLAEPALTAAACARLRVAISGSAPMLVATHEAWRARTGQTMLERYGMSETLMLTSNPCRPADGPRRIGTVGPALPGTGLRIVGADEAVLAQGQTGDVQVRGPSVCSGYWRLTDKTAEAFTPDDWFRTGDVGHLDAQGYLTLVGRSKDLIISGGYNVYPAEVEDVLNNLPGVVESAVIGVPHADWGEAVVAVVVPAPGARLEAAALLAALKPRLAAYKLPKHLALATELPRNVMGKVQKNRLREQHAALFA